MMALAHAGLGWAIGTALPYSDRRLRIACAAAALLPDLDLLTRLGGSDRFPHALGHNIFAGALCFAAAAWAFRSYALRSWILCCLTAAFCFALHLAIDLKVSGWDLPLYFPLSRRGLSSPALLPPGGGADLTLSILFLALPWALAFWKKVTPLEIVSPRLDTLFINFVRRRKHACYECGRKCNNRCSTCTHPVCFQHGKLGWHFRLTCSSCRSGAPPKKPSNDESLEAYMARQLQFLRGKEAVRLDNAFASFLHRKLMEGLRRLDAVPRSHPLWQHSDPRPTLAKLMDLSRTLLKEAPEDDESRWVLFADKVLTCSPDLEFSLIEPAILRDFASLRWMVAAARWSYVFSGVNPVVVMKGPMESLSKTVGPLEPFLQALGEEKNPATREAAAQCLELVQGRNPFKTT